MIRNRLGKTFHFGAILVGYVLLLFSLWITLECGYSLVNTFTKTMDYSLVSFVSFVALFVAGAVLASTSDGIIIDALNNKVKVYTSIFGLGLGGWSDLNMYPCLCVFGYETLWAVKDNDPSKPAYKKKYDLCLMSAKHYRRILVKNFKEKEDAIAYAQKLESLLSKDFVKYNPGKLKHVKYNS